MVTGDGSTGDACPESSSKVLELHSIRKERATTTSVCSTVTIQRTEVVLTITLIFRRRSDVLLRKDSSTLKISMV